MAFELHIKNNVYSKNDFLKEGFRDEQPILDLCARWFREEGEFRINTSGSTGKPKSILLERDMLKLSALKTIDFLKLPPGTKALLCIHTEYIGGLMMLIRAMIGEWKLWVVEPSRHIFETDHSDFDFAAVVPLQLKDAAPEFLPKKIIVGGGPLSPPLEEKLSVVQTSEIFATYGMTETYSHIALRKVNGANRSEYFTPLPGISVGIDKNECLTIKGDITLQKTINTRDLAVFQGGTFKVTGRIDNLINSGGIKIAPEKIEEKISPFMKGTTYFSGGISHQDYGEVVVLFIETAHNIPLDKLWKEFATYLHKYEIPKEIITLEKFIYTDTEKIDRRKTIEKYLSKNLSG